MAENVILKHQSLTISQQIEELRNWHRQQQSKINPETAEKSAKNNVVERLGYKQQHENPTSQQSKINPTTAERSAQNDAVKRLGYKQQHENPTSQQNFDDTPVKVVNTNLSELIENNINPTDGVLYPNNEKPKFRYLKRGEGIARFGMRPQKISKFGNKNKQGLNLSTRNKRLEGKRLNNDEKGQTHILKKYTVEKQDEIPTLDPPDLKLNFKNWKSIFSSEKAEEIFEKAIDNNHLEIFLPNSSIDSSTASIIEKCMGVGKKRLKEEEELRVFETIEQHVLDSSFCSTSSYVTKLMKNAVISTPEKKSFPNHNTSSSNIQPDKPPTVPQIGENLENSNPNNVEQKNIEPVIWKTEEKRKLSEDQLQDTEHSENMEQSFHVRFAEKNDYKSFVEYSQCENSSSQKETYFDKEIDDSDEWKEESEEDCRCCSECSTTYSSSDEDVSAISPPVKPPTILQVGHSKYQSETQNPVQRSPEKLDIVNTEKNSTHNKECTMSPNNGINKFPSVSNEKLRELLENEIKMFNAENNKLKTLRKSLEKERKQFQLEKKKFLKEIEDKKEIAAQHEMEKQKLAKEKFIFEKYCKSLKKNPTKEERKEIQALKEQLSEMKEELNKKESRWGSAQARVRNQMKLLEEDNKKLREELEILRKQSKHLEFLTQKRKGKAFNNTKLIHAISDCISNVDVEGDADTMKGSSAGSYFNPKSNVKIVVVDEVDPKNISGIKVIREDGNKNNKKSLCHNGTNDKLVESLNKKIVINEESTDDNHTSPLPKPASPREGTDYNNKKTELLEEINLQNLNKGDQSQENPVVCPRETVNEDGIVEKVYPDGRKEISYKNGNVKKIDPLTGNEKMYYFNGDVKEIISDGTVKYYYAESRIWHTTLFDGLEVLDFPNGQIEKRHTNGMVEIIYPNNCKIFTYPDGSEEIYYPDGTTLRIEANKRELLSLPNGQKEIRTKEFTRREYPNGTVKNVYPDGTSETVYANGRVRLKDKHGNLVMDSGTSANSTL